MDEQKRVHQEVEDEEPDDGFTQKTRLIKLNVAEVKGLQKGKKVQKTCLLNISKGLEWGEQFHDWNKNSPATYLCPKANNEWKSREHDGIECTGEVGRCYVWYTPLFKKIMNNQIKLTLRYLTLKSSEKRTLIGIKSVAKSEYLFLINWSNGIYFKLGYKHEILKCNVTHCRWIAYKGCTCTFW